MRRISSIICIVLVVATLLGSALWVPVSAENFIFESGSALYTCEIYGCHPTETYGVGASILVNSEATPAAAQALVEWVSLDDFNAGLPAAHVWVQTGYAIGALPDGTFASQPVFYTESNLPRSDNTCCVYTFHNKGTTGFGAWHNFNVWTTGNAPSTTFVTIDGVVQEAITEQYFLKGQATGSLEAHMDRVPQPDGNGHWTNLQFYTPNCYLGVCGVSWKPWGSSDGNSLFGTTTSALYFITCDGYGLQQISSTEFTVGGSAPRCLGGGGGCSKGCGFRIARIPVIAESPQFLGPGSYGGAPEAPSTINPIAYWLVGISVAVATLYGVYRVRKRRMAKSDRPGL